ncbi:unnamed protein product [Amoebophrya sp. A25]|nr:unnamed protein product [Amoebophrya sp. A25]|eukprot:GSA25T00008193001.1
MPLIQASFLPIFTTIMPLSKNHIPIYDTNYSTFYEPLIHLYNDIKFIDIQKEVVIDFRHKGSIKGGRTYERINY